MDIYMSYPWMQGKENGIYVFFIKLFLVFYMTRDRFYIYFESGALSSKMLPVKIVKNIKIDAYYRVG